MSRYSKEHYEDVVSIFAKYSRGLHDGIVRDFADLFAADNPPGLRCWGCGNTKETASDFSCIRSDGEHSYGGFDREKFLAACGLE